MDSQSSPKGMTNLRSRIERLRRAVIFNDLLALILIAIGFFALGVLVCAVFFFSGWCLLLLLLPLIGLGFSWLKETGLKKVAYRVERFFPEIRNRLVSALELGEYRPGVEGYSLELRDAAIAEVEELLEPLPLKKAIPSKRVLFAFLWALMGSGILTGYLAFFGERAKLGLKNGFSPNSVKIEFNVSPQDTTVLPRSEVKINVRVKPAGVFKKVWLETKRGSGTSLIARRALRVYGDSCFISLVVDEGLRYRFKVLGRNSDWYWVTVLKPLELKRLVFICTPPRYANLPQTRLSTTELTLLKGTRVDFEGEVDQPTAGGRVIFGGETTEVRTDTITPERFFGSFFLNGDGEGILELKPRGGGSFQTVTRIRLRVVKDEEPWVKVFLPGRDVDLPMSMQVLLGINSIDDFGLGELWLHYGKESISGRVRLKGLANRREDTTFYVWNLSSVGLLPGEALKYYVRVSDNDAVSGPKSTKSEVFAIRFPTMAEIYAQTVEKAQATAGELEPVAAEQAKVSEELIRLSEELKKTRQLSWEEKRRLEGLLAEQVKILERLEKLKEEVARSQAELASGMNWDQETWERLGQLQELLSRILPEELQKSLKELGKKLSERSGDLQPVLEKLRLQEEEMKKNIERALELLKRIIEEGRLEALARTAEELARAEEEINRRLERVKPQELINEQAKVQQGLDSLKQELAQLAKDFSDPAFGESLSNLAKKLDQSEIAELSEKLARQLSAGDQKGARLSSEEMKKILKELAQSLKSLAESLKRNRAREVARKLLTSADELLTLSQSQERLEERLKKGEGQAKLAQEQMGIYEGTKIVAESLTSLGAQTLMVPPQLGQALARALNFMKEGANALNEPQSYLAGKRMADARQSLNKAVGMVLDAAGQAGQSSGLSTGLENLLQALAQMTAEQMAINASMSGLPIPIPASGLSAEQLQQLMELLSRQKRLREQLEKLLQSMGGERPGLTGALDQLIEEMRAVERSLAELQIDRKLIERQEGILSHLLDAQRSLRQEGFKEERRAETAKEYKIEPPPGLPEDKGERNRALREELLRALKQGYPPEYERLIRNYFEKLLQE